MRRGTSTPFHQMAHIPKIMLEKIGMFQRNNYSSIWDEHEDSFMLFFIIWLICFVILFIPLGFTFLGFCGAFGLGLIAAFILTLIYWVVTLIVKELE